MRFNFLLDEFPTWIMIGGKRHDINTSYRTILNIIRTSEDELFGPEEKIAINIDLFYKDIPKDLNVAYQEMLEFISMYEEQSETHRPKEKVFDYEIDADRIHAAFYQQYKIDLLDSDMHWFRFLKLLSNLSDTPSLLNIMHIRSMKVEDSMSATEKARIRKLKKEYALNDGTEQQGTVSFADIFSQNIGKGGKK